MRKILLNLLREARIFWMQYRIITIPKIKLDFKKSVIIAPHPDDEVFGCGGLIAKLVACGNAPYIIIMTGGEASHRGCCAITEEDIAKARNQLTIRAAQILGLPFDHIYCLNYPDGEIDPRNTEETARLRRLLNQLNCDAVFIPHWGEGWSDHLQTAEIVKKIVQKDVELYEYCVWVWYYNVWNLDWSNARQLNMKDNEYLLKKNAVAQYVLPRASCGNPWSGILPSVFLKANNQNRELYFKINY